MHFYVSHTRPLEKVKIFTLLLIVMATLIPVTTRAEEFLNIRVLSTKRIIKNPDTICNDWELNTLDVKEFFKTVKPLTSDVEMNSFDIYGCNIEGHLISKGIKWNYRINLGGYAVWFTSKTTIHFGCREGGCLKYVHYEPYPD